MQTITANTPVAAPPNSHRWRVLAVETGFVHLMGGEAAVQYSFASATHLASHAGSVE